MRPGEHGAQVFKVEQDVAHGRVANTAFDPADTDEALAERDGLDLSRLDEGIEDEVAGSRLCLMRP